jgi:hypothetical protein
MKFGRIKRRLVEANFQGGAIGSDGGLMLLRQVDRKIGLSAAVAAALADPRDPSLIEHSLRNLIAQRLYGLCCGYEDLPLYVFAGKALLACVLLRSSRIDGAKHAAAIVKLLATRLRQAWPKTRIIVRADAGFCRQRLIQVGTVKYPG